MRRSHEEDNIQRGIVSALRGNGYCVFAVPNGGARRPIEAAILKGMGVLAGVADLCVLLSKGRTLWLEVKATAGRQSPSQKEFGEICQRLGHTYAVVRSMDDVYPLLRRNVNES